MKSEELIKVIKLSGAKLANEDKFCELDDKLQMNRTILFSLLGNDYNIEWFTNLMTLRAPCGIDIKFTDVEWSGTFPNEFKRNLQFRYGRECVAILGVEQYVQESY